MYFLTSHRKSIVNVRAFVRVRVRACVRAWVRACVHLRLYVCHVLIKHHACRANAN